MSRIGSGKFVVSLAFFIYERSIGMYKWHEDYDELWDMILDLPHLIDLVDKTIGAIPAHRWDITFPLTMAFGAALRERDIFRRYQWLNDLLLQAREQRLWCDGTGYVVSSNIDGEPNYADCPGCPNCEADND